MRLAIAAVIFDAALCVACGATAEHRSAATAIQGTPTSSAIVTSTPAPASPPNDICVGRSAVMLEPSPPARIVAITPAVLTRGSNVTLEVDGFSPNKNVRVQIMGISGERRSPWLAEAVADGGGRALLRFLMPDPTPFGTVPHSCVGLTVFGAFPDWASDAVVYADPASSAPAIPQPRPSTSPLPAPDWARICDDLSKSNRSGAGALRLSPERPTLGEVFNVSGVGFEGGEYTVGVFLPDGSRGSHYQTVRVGSDGILSATLTLTDWRPGVCAVISAFGAGKAFYGTPLIVR